MNDETADGVATDERALVSGQRLEDVGEELAQARRRLAAMISTYPSRTWPVPLINAVISVVEAQGLPAQVTEGTESAIPR